MKLEELRRKLEVLEDKGFEEINLLDPVGLAGSPKPSIFLDGEETIYLEDIETMEE